MTRARQQEEGEQEGVIRRKEKLQWGMGETREGKRRERGGRIEDCFRHEERTPISNSP